MGNKLFKLIVVPAFAMSAFFAFSNVTKASAPVNYSGAYKETSSVGENALTAFKLKAPSYVYKVKTNFNKKTEVAIDYVSKTSKIAPKGKYYATYFMTGKSLKNGKKITLVIVVYGSKSQKSETIVVPNSTKL